MANIPLQTIKFPGLDDTYTVPQVDDTLAIEGQAADAKVTGDTLKRKANIDGSYDLMNTGTSDNWTPYSADSGATQDIPFINEATGGGNGESVVDTGSYLQFKKKLGNTAGVNQLVQNGDFSNGSSYWNVLSGATIDSVASNILTATLAATAESGIYHVALDIVASHKYLRIATIKSSVAVKHSIASAYPISTTGSGNWETLIDIMTWGYASGSYAPAYGRKDAGEATAQMQIKEVRYIDLTLWYGSNDRIPSDLLSHPENWGRYYAGSLAYNAGTLESADGTVMRSIGRNVWDEEWERANIDWSTNKFVPAANGARLCPKNFIEVIPNTQYYVYVPATAGMYIVGYTDTASNGIGLTASYNIITIPSNIRYIKFGVVVDNYGTTYKNDITISLYYPGESGYSEYYPYSVLAEVGTGSEVLRGVEGSRDEKLPSGAIQRNRARIDLGTLDYGYNTSSSVAPYFYVNLPDCYAPSSADVSSKVPTLICSRYVAAIRTTLAFTDKSVTLDNTGVMAQLQIKDTAYTDPAAFKAAMSGVYLEYPLATPTTEQGTAFAENIPCDDFGSLMWTQTKGIPQGNEIFYPVDYKASFDTLYNIVDGDMSRIVIDDDLAVYNTKTEDDAKFATKDAVGGTLRQLLAVKAEIGFADTAYVDLASATWSNYSTNLYSASVVADAKDPASDWSTAVAISTKYPITSRNGLTEGTVAIKQGNVLFYSTTVGSVANVPSAMKGVLLAYEKASS